ncbi:MAG: phosphate-starvation-inducible PsiE family protein [Methanothrix sp.]|nr:phosphate-starvation-inducible PsiE family protein [Methanothrix sp.]
MDQIVRVSVGSAKQEASSFKGGEEVTTYLERFQSIILALLTWTMTIVTLLATLDVIYTLAKYLIFPPLSLQTTELLSFFGSILLVLIGVELLETFKTFQRDKTVNVLSVLLVALIVMARKVIIMEINDGTDDMGQLGLSAIIISLSLGYYLIKRSGSIEK